MDDSLLERVNSVLRLKNYVILREQELQALRKQQEQLAKQEALFSKPSHNNTPLPESATVYLQHDNQRLRELRERYRSLQLPVVHHSVWSDEYVSSEVDLRFFRGDYAYLYQYRNQNFPANYILTTYYLKTIDTLRLLNVLKEDALFGAYVFDFNGEFTVSRDLLDSMVEIYFLERTLGISHTNYNFLDIGAGYGRLAHRIVNSLPQVGRVYCVDAVAESTFLCEYYLQFRGVGDRAITIPLDEIEETLASNHVDVATNMCSFPESTLASTIWWLDLLRKHAVRYLMIVPNSPGTQLLSMEKGQPRHLDMLPAITSRGYRLIAKSPKYLDPSVQEYGVTPSIHYLFELSP